MTILSIINSFKVFREIYLLTGNYPYDGLYMMQHFMNNMFNSADYQRLSAAAVLLAIVIVIPHRPFVLRGEHLRKGRGRMKKKRYFSRTVCFLPLRGVRAFCSCCRRF